MLVFLKASIAFSIFQGGQVFVARRSIKPLQCNFALLMIRIEDIIEKVADNRPNPDIELIRRAYLFSALHHKGQISLFCVGA